MQFRDRQAKRAKYGNPHARRGTSPALSLAERVVRASDREHPADAVLRVETKAQRDLSPEERTQASAAVFAFFRWRGWLNPQQPVCDQIESALALAQKYSRQPDSFSDAELVARAVPGWVAAAMEVSPGWARALQTPPRLWLRARRGQGKTLADKLRDCRLFGQGTLSDTVEYRGPEDLFRTAEFHAGEFELQDISSQAVGLICDPRPGETWWDACAGEGGKTLHLSDLMENKGLIWASDPAAWRLQRLRRRAGRARVFNYRAAAWDGGPKLPTKTRFDGVLVDAPCSGLGTWQRNPHARWTVTPQDVRELSDVQGRVLAHTAAAVKPGGKLIYAVCALTRAETVEVAEAFEKQFPGFERLPLSNPLDANAPPGAQIEYWPQQFGGSGMFVAGWVRRAG
jgi:16S rRNA (cytosine967-C5)-methyltransferase